MVNRGRVGGKVGNRKEKGYVWCSTGGSAGGWVGCVAPPPSSSPPVGRFARRKGGILG